MGKRSRLKANPKRWVEDAWFPSGYPKIELPFLMTGTTPYEAYDFFVPGMVELFDAWDDLGSQDMQPLSEVIPEGSPTTRLRSWKPSSNEWLKGFIKWNWEQGNIVLLAQMEEKADDVVFIAAQRVCDENYEAGVTLIADRNRK
jgi:hypothetical protein